MYRGSHSDQDSIYSGSTQRSVASTSKAYSRSLSLGGSNSAAARLLCPGQPGLGFTTTTSTTTTTATPPTVGGSGGGIITTTTTEPTTRVARTVRQLKKSVCHPNRMRIGCDGTSSMGEEETCSVDAIKMLDHPIITTRPAHRSLSTVLRLRKRVTGNSVLPDDGEGMHNTNESSRGNRQAKRSVSLLRVSYLDHRPPPLPPESQISATDPLSSFTDISRLGTSASSTWSFASFFKDIGDSSTMSTTTNHHHHPHHHDNKEETKKVIGDQVSIQSRESKESKNKKSMASRVIRTLSSITTSSATKTSRRRHQRYEIPANEDAAVDNQSNHSHCWSDRTRLSSSPSPSIVEETAATRAANDRSFVLLDFGCTRCGYGYYDGCSTTSTTMDVEHDFQKELLTKRLSSSVLLNPKSEFHSMGESALRYYYDMTASDRKKWFFIDNILKQIFDKRSVSIELTVFAANDSELLVSEVFSQIMTHIAQHINILMQNQHDCRLFHWLISIADGWFHETLRDIWRLAASVSGINKCHFVSSTDAIWIFVDGKEKYDKLLHSMPCLTRVSSGYTEATRSRSSSRQSSLGRQSDKNNGKSLIIKIGGHNLMASCTKTNSSQTIFLPGGGVGGGGGGGGFITTWNENSGSKCVNQEFMKILESIFGSNVMWQYKIKYPLGYYELEEEIEFQKSSLLSAHVDRRSFISVSLPFSFLVFIQKTLGRPVEKIIRDLRDNSLLWTSEGMIQVSLQRMRYLFEPSLMNIQAHLNDLLTKIRDITQIYIVGGFLDSAILRDDLHFSLGQKYEIIIPIEPNLSILKGMRILATNIIQPPLTKQPDQLFQAQHSYGLAVLKPFQVNDHPSDKRIHRHGRDWCVDIFDCLLHIGETYYNGYTLKRQFTTASVEQKCVKVNFYRWKSSNGVVVSSNNNNNNTESLSKPLFITDHGVRYIGQLIIKLTKSSTTRIQSDNNSSSSAGGAKINRQSSFVNNICGKNCHTSTIIQAEFQFHSEEHFTFRAKDIRTNESFHCQFVTKQGKMTSNNKLQTNGNRNRQQQQQQLPSVESC